MRLVRFLVMRNKISLRVVVQLPALVAMAVLGYGKEYEWMAAVLFIIIIIIMSFTANIDNENLMVVK